MKKLLITCASSISLVFCSNAFAATLVSKKTDDKILSYEISAKKISNSRNIISPKTNSSSFSFNQESINNLPQGQASSINQVLLRAPSVTQDSYGQIHVRGDHSNLQYRINDVIIPEGINGFGQAIDTRFADSMTLLTGTLPAQYGLRTAGVIDIKTKDHVAGSKLSNGSYSEIITGSNKTFGANQQISGSRGALNYFVSASYLQNNRGLETPTANESIHNNTQQDKIFGYFSYMLDASQKLSFIVANANNRFQIPNNPNQVENYQLSGASPINSSQINEKQLEQNSFSILSLQGSSDFEIDYQLSGFLRHSRMIFEADHVGDLIFNGVASDINRNTQSSGVQGDFTKEINDKNIFRFGFYATQIAVKNEENSEVFASTNGVFDTTTTSIESTKSRNNKLYSAYAQNEFKPNSKFTINFGARFDLSQGQINENQLSPRAGMVYDLNPKTKIHAGFARYFTTPKSELLTNGDLSKFANTSNAPQNFVNNPVKAERSNYYNTGLTHQLNENFNITFSGFFKDVKNLLDEGQFGNALIYKPFNYREAKIYGLEFGSDYKKNNFSAFFNFSLQRSKAKHINSSEFLFEEDELDFIAKNYVNTDHAQKITGSLGASYQVENIRFGGDVIFGSGLRRGFANTKSLPFYSQTNIFVTREIAKFQFRLALNNALNRTYKLRDGSGIGVGASQFAMKRSVFLIISKTF